MFSALDFYVHSSSSLCSTPLCFSMLLCAGLLCQEWIPIATSPMLAKMTNASSAPRWDPLCDCYVTVSSSQANHSWFHCILPSLFLLSLSLSLSLHTHTQAKIFQALFSTVSVQILVTFHGGMVALGYEWGSMDHPRGKDLCPDHVAHKEIGESMARWGKILGLGCEWRMDGWINAWINV